MPTSYVQCKQHVQEHLLCKQYVQNNVLYVVYSGCTYVHCVQLCVFKFNWCTLYTKYTCTPTMLWYDVSHLVTCLSVACVYCCPY